MSASREAWVCTKRSGLPGANAATSLATLHERYFCAVATRRRTSQAGRIRSRRSRLWFFSLGRCVPPIDSCVPPTGSCAPPAGGRVTGPWVSGSGQSMRTILATAAASLVTTLAPTSSSASHEQSTSRATTTTGATVVGRATSPAGLTSRPASALTSVLLPVPVPPMTPTTRTRESSRRARSSRGATSSHSARTRRAGGQSGSAPLHRASPVMRSSNPASSNPGAGVGGTTVGASFGPREGMSVIWRTPAHSHRATVWPAPPPAGHRPWRAARSPRGDHRGRRRGA